MPTTRPEDEDLDAMSITTPRFRPPSASHHTVRRPDFGVKAQSYSSKFVLQMSKMKLTTTKAVLDRKLDQPDPYPWEIMILSENVITRLHGINMCVNLRKLDLSDNQLKTLPNKSFWKCLPKLETLFLHNNKIDSIHSLQSL